MAFRNPSPKQKTGLAMEAYACAYLQKRGLTLITQNYHTRFGEIDLIMQDKDMLVFVEVRYRQSQKFGGAIESIDYFKEQRIIHAAQYYLMKFNLTHDVSCRFDIVAISGNCNTPEIEWILDAFEGVSE